MAPKPAHLTAANAARFQDRSVVDLYHLRLPYPPEAFDILLDLITDEPRMVLDVGTGTGELARQLAERVDCVDAVDVSAAMIARDQTLPGGDQPRLRWIEGAIEDAPLRPPYALIMAGDSIHWMDWDVVFPRFAEVCSLYGFVALVHRTELDSPWQDGVTRLIQQYSTMRDYEPFDLIEQLERRCLFQTVGRRETTPVTSRQSVEDYIASFHSRSSLSRDHMQAVDANAFDQQLRTLVEPWSTDGLFELRTVGGVVWGRPQGGLASIQQMVLDKVPPERSLSEELSRERREEAARE
jgi:SAM-dependent methyltransferase